MYIKREEVEPQCEKNHSGRFLQKNVGGQLSAWVRFFFLVVVLPGFHFVTDPLAVI